MNEQTLQDYADAWGSHDIDRVMSYMTEDCEFVTGGGSESFGTRYCGFETVKERFQEVFDQFPDVEFRNARHFVSGDRGCSEWTFVATKPDGSVMEVDGCDLFEFSDGKIRVKNSYLKNRQ